MTMFAQPLAPNIEETIPNELVALARLEGTSNAIRLRIASLAPDQLYRGTVDQLSIAEELSLAVDRERAFLHAFTQVLRGANVTLEEPRPGGLSLDRDFGDDLATFFDLRRGTLDLLRTVDDEGWNRTVVLPDNSRVPLRNLAIMLAQRDAALLQTISQQRRIFLRTTGVDELRDYGVAGKLGPNIGQ